jgi:hypothetical protein
MKFHFFVLTFTLFYIANCLGQQKTDNQLTRLTSQQWRQDLRSLYDSLQVNHLNLFHFTRKAVFEKKYQSIFNEIPRLQYHEILLRFKQFVSLAGDGHTTLQEPADYKKYPLNFFVFNKQVILVKSGEEYKAALGWPLIAINGYSIDQIRDSLNTIVDHGESTSYVLKQQMDRLPIAEYLMAFGFITNPDSAVFEFKKGTQNIKMKAAAHQTDKAIKWQWAYRPLPLFLNTAQGEESINHQPIDSKTYYINFSGYPSWGDFEKITENIYTSLNHQKTTNKIIIDMRLNGGGNFDKGLKLMLPMFLNFNALHPGVKYYVVIGRQTFSAGMSNAVHFRDCLDAKLVGEFTGANPNGYQEIKWFRLPNSMLTASCSQLYYTFQKKNSNGVLPDKKIAPSFEDYKQGNDPVLNWILKKSD